VVVSPRQTSKTCQSFVDHRLVHGDIPIQFRHGVYCVPWVPRRRGVGETHNGFPCTVAEDLTAWQDEEYFEVSIYLVGAALRLKPNLNYIGHLGYLCWTLLCHVNRFNVKPAVF